MTDNRKPAPQYGFDRLFDVVFDDRTDGPKPSSPARIAFREARKTRRAKLQEAARLNSPAAIAARIYAGGKA